MFSFDTTDLQRIAVSSVGALILSTACILGSTGPVRAAEPNAPLTVGDWQAEVEQQIDSKLRMPANALGSGDHAVATVAVAFDASGGFSDAKVVRSSGAAVLDREAMRVARAIAYPALPSGLRGEPRTVIMQLYFGKAFDPASAARHDEAVEALANGGSPERRATRTAALPAG